MGRGKLTTVYLGLVLLLIALVLLSINTGTLGIRYDRVLQTIIGNGTGYEKIALWDLRLPRIVISMIVGTCLAVSGAIMQGITNNDLAEPGVLGINAGAGVGILLAIYSFKGISSKFLIPISAIIGALLTFYLIYSLSKKYNLSPVKLVLNGIAIKAAIGALILVITMRLSPMDHSYASVILSGSLTGSNWSIIHMSFPIVLVFTLYIFYKARYLNVLTLGDDFSIGLGIDLGRERKKLLAVAVSLAGISSAIAGGISFIGLLAPHISRKVLGSNYKRLLPTSALVGMIIMVLSDVIARNIFSPEEIPVGIVVAVIGSPYLLYLLFTSDK